MDWGLDGLVRLAQPDVVVVVDVLRFSTTVIRALENGDAFPLDAAAHAVSVNGAAVAEAAGRAGSLVLLGGLRNATAVARTVYAEQERRGARTSIAIVACGELTGRAADAHLRFAVEDQLGAGAIVDALGTLGIDHTSPEAAVAGESFRALSARREAPGDRERFGARARRRRPRRRGGCCGRGGCGIRGPGPAGRCLPRVLKHGRPPSRSSVTGVHRASRNACIGDG